MKSLDSVSHAASTFLTMFRDDEAVFVFVEHGHVDLAAPAPLSFHGLL
jgi:hypothetical protein